MSDFTASRFIDWGLRSRMLDKYLEDQADIRSWLDKKLADPEWVAKMKARSDEADAQIREMGLLPGKPTDQHSEGSK